MGMTLRKAIAHINRRGALLVFPVQNRKEPPSLWKEFYPRKKMVWEWDETGDNRINDLWCLMKELSSSQKVVYSKWYQNRATFLIYEDLWQGAKALTLEKSQAFILKKLGEDSLFKKSHDKVLQSLHKIPEKSIMGPRFLDM